ncbi:MAG: hypothetical protein HYW77_02455 [Parcubacteria group bacterium]|nr:hypothetical protein [Parcubacteria group bacterium]
MKKATKAVKVKKALELFHINDIIDQYLASVLAQHQKTLNLLPVFNQDPNKVKEAMMRLESAFEGELGQKSKSVFYSMAEVSWQELADENLDRLIRLLKEPKVQEYIVFSRIYFEELSRKTLEIWHSVFIKIFLEAVAKVLTDMGLGKVHFLTLTPLPGFAVENGIELDPNLDTSQLDPNDIL